MEAQPPRESPHFSNERVHQHRVREAARARAAHVDAPVQPRAGEARGVQGEPVIAPLLALLVEGADQVARAQEVLLDHARALELQSVIDRHVDLDLGGPLVAGRHPHVAGAVRLRLRDDVGGSDEAELAQDPFGLLEEKRVRAVPLAEQQLAGDESLPRVDVHEVGEPARPAQDARLGRGSRVEDGLAFDDDARDRSFLAGHVVAGRLCARRGHRQEPEQQAGAEEPEQGARGEAAPCAAQSRKAARRGGANGSRARRRSLNCEMRQGRRGMLPEGKLTRNWREADPKNR